MYQKTFFLELIISLFGLQIVAKINCVSYTTFFYPLQQKSFVIFLLFLTNDFFKYSIEKFPALAVFDRNFKDLLLHRWVSASIFLGFLLLERVSLHAIPRAVDSLSLTVGSKISSVRTMQGNIINLFVYLYYHIIFMLSILCAGNFYTFNCFFSIYLSYACFYSLICLDSCIIVYQLFIIYVISCIIC